MTSRQRNSNHKPWGARPRSFAGDGVFRFSMGIEDPEDLIEDLEQILK